MIKSVDITDYLVLCLCFQFLHIDDTFKSG